MQKVCFKCGQELPLDQFYKHPRMTGGYLNKCKECTKKDARKNRAEKLDYYREYDRARGCRTKHEYTSEYRKTYKNKYRAHNMVNNFIRDGKLFPESCVICGDIDTHGHHDDYAKPLNVRWLCAEHHKQWHIEHGEGLNG